MRKWTYLTVKHEDKILLVAQEQEGGEPQVLASCPSLMQANHLLNALRARMGEMTPAEPMKMEGEVFVNGAGIKIHHDPSVPPGTIELRDLDTGQVLGRITSLG